MAERRYEHSPSISQMADKPLFGVSSRREQILNWSFAVFTSIVVTVTVISAFIFPNWSPSGLNIFFAICITLMCPAHIILEEKIVSGGTDLMSDLTMKLQMRRKGISGAKQRDGSDHGPNLVISPEVAFESMASMIPAPPQDTSKTSDDDNTDDWD